MLRKGLRIAGLVVAGLIALYAVALAGSTYLRRWTFLMLPDVGDYAQLPSRPISRSPKPFFFPAAIDGDWVAPLHLNYQGHALNNAVELGEFVSTHGTTAFIVIKDGKILDERYFNGYRRDSLFKSFSVSKSVLSLLIGTAIEDGLIASIDDPVTKYIPEMKDPRFRQVTLRHCLDNTAGIEYSRGAMPWAGQPRMYYTNDARAYVQKARIIAEPGTRFSPEDISPIILGYVLERALERHPTAHTISDYLAFRVWQPLGAEYDALWNVDREKDGLEKGESGFTARAIDLARFASLYLNEGRWGSRQIVSSSWVIESTTAAGPAPNVWPDGFHRHQWWGRETNAARPDFYANGHFGQRLYVSPRNRLVIVRMGTDNKGVDWADFAGSIADCFAQLGAK